MVFWVVRAGSEGQQENAAIENNLVTIGWNELQDITGIDKIALKKVWQKVFPNHTKAQSANELGQVLSFVREIQKGDLVALPLKSRPSIMLGEITSDYQYKEIRPDIHHIRFVNWIMEISRSEIDEDLLKSLGTFMTVFKIKKPNAEKRIRRIMQSINQDTHSSTTVSSQNYESVSGISISNLPEILNEFRKWLKSDVGQKHMDSLQQEIDDVNNIIEKLRSLDRTSPEFVDWILYGLLPHSKTKLAKRFSMFPAFYNFKSFFSSNYHYKDQNDWLTIANMIYNLIIKFQQSPKQLDKWIDEFVSDKVYSRGLQCGAISPILFCINKSFPIINSRVIHTYNDFATMFGWHDNMSPKLSEYLNNIEKCNKLIDALGVAEFHDFALFDEFCYWYDYLYQAENDDEEDDISYELTEKTKMPEVDFEEFFTKLNLETASGFDEHSLRNPERTKIIEIIRECSTGRWALPNFQRYFDWKKNDVREFLKSIFHDYYVGCLLFWEAANELQLDTMPINGVDIKKDDEPKPRLIILDGQQRITSLYYAIKAPKFPLKGGTKSPLYFYINFGKYFMDEQDDEIIEVLPWKVSREESFARMLFPFYELEDYGVWSYDFEDFLHKKVPNSYDKIRKIRSIMERKLWHIREGFEIPYITLPSTMELHNVTDIFERINTMGKILNSFDLLIARLSKYAIKLRDLWEETIKRFPKIKSYDKVIGKLPVYIIQAMSLCYNKTSSCKKQDILNIYQLAFESTDISFEDKWYEMSEYMDNAICKLENMRDGFGVKDETELPFAPMIPILAALLKEIDSHHNKIDSINKVKMWYWSSVFSNAYSSAVESQLTLDFRDMKEWFVDGGKIPRTVERARREIMTIDLRQVQVKSSAIYRGILSLLALKGAKDFDTNLTLENARNNDKDHIFPRKEFDSEKNVNSILNMTWMSDETNRRKGYKRPSQFCKSFIVEKYSGNERDFLNTLETHFISGSGYDCLLRDDFEGFITIREGLILSHIRHCIGIPDIPERPTLISPGKPFGNAKIMRDTIRSCEGYIHWIDKYFSNEGLEMLYESVNKNKVNSIKILTSIQNTTSRLRKSFERLKQEFENENIRCELRVITNSSLASNIHDRWILSKNASFNIPSPDVVARGQLSEVKKTDNVLPFDDMWKNSLDIISDWNDIDKIIQQHNHQKIR